MMSLLLPPYILISRAGAVKLRKFLNCVLSQISLQAQILSKALQAFVHHGQVKAQSACGGGGSGAS